MAEVFNAYAKYYDLLYKDKDYAAEAAYIDGLIKKHKPGAQSVLNLGCGTGKHDACLKELGYKVSGVDLSPVMLEEAKKRAVPGCLEFYHGDARTADLKRKFDVVISLFHVMSYQVTNEDILAAFRTAARHLAPGGVFIFDFWHGGGVLSDPPVVRVKRLEDDLVRIVRIAEPELKKERNVVEVNYQILTLEKKTARWSELRETHSMRYFFLPELIQFLSDTGFALKNSGGWMTDKPLCSCWYGLVAAEKRP